MTEPEKVVAAESDAIEPLVEPVRPVQDCIHPTVGSWFIRYHASGSWSVVSERDAANDSNLTNK